MKCVPDINNTKNAMIILNAKKIFISFKDFLGKVY